MFPLSKWNVWVVLAGFETSGSFQVLSEALCGAGMEVHQFNLSPLQIGASADLTQWPRFFMLKFASILGGQGVSNSIHGVISFNFSCEVRFGWRL